MWSLLWKRMFLPSWFSRHGVSTTINNRDCNRTKMIVYSKIFLHNEAGGCRFLIILLCSQHNPLMVCVWHVMFLWWQVKEYSVRSRSLTLKNPQPGVTMPLPVKTYHYSVLSTGNYMRSMRIDITHSLILVIFTLSMQNYVEMFNDFSFDFNYVRLKSESCLLFRCGKATPRKN